VFLKSAENRKNIDNFLSDMELDMMEMLKKKKNSKDNPFNK
jgi:hypothetical protein